LAGGPSEERNVVAKEILTPDLKQKRRAEAVIDYSKGYINRRDFLFKMTAIGISAAYASRVADVLAMPKPVPSFNRWEKQAEATVRFVKGEHAPTDPEIWEGLAEQFAAAHPGLKLQPEFFQWGTMQDELTAGYASGSPWDSVYLVDLVLAKYASSGVVADITAMTNDPAYAAEKSAIAPFTWDVTNVGGKQVGVGALGAVFHIFYNLTHFQNAGITEFPTTREALRDAAIAMTKDGVFGMEFRDSVPSYAWWDWFPYVHNDGADVMTPDLTAQALDPAAIPGTQFLAELRHEHKVTPETGAYDWEGKAALFQAGRIAIYHDESWRAPVWHGADTGFEFDVALAPANPDTGKQTAMGNFGYATISEASQNKEAAWEFVKWWTSADVINNYAAQVGLQTVRVDSVPPYTDPALQKIQAEFVPKVQGVQIHVNYLQMLQTLWPEIERAYRGEQTAEEAIKKAGEIVTGLISAEPAS
jgi:ABC-type glycerol-3-phosphate transport system substrate-binding protein